MRTVSVLLPVKGDDPTPAIDSVWAPGIDMEVVVIAAPETEYQPHRSGVRVVEGPGTNVAAALNAGFEAASGEYIARQDADDRSLFRRLEEQLAAVDRLDVVGTGAVIDRGGQFVGIRRVPRTVTLADLRSGNELIHGSVLMHRDVLASLDGYDESLDYNEDYDLWLRAAESFALGNVDAPLYKLSLDVESVTAQQTRAMIEETNDRLPDPEEPTLATAKRLLRYGQRRRARAALRADWSMRPGHVGLAGLSLMPQRVVDGVIRLVRKRKNRKLADRDG